MSAPAAKRAASEAGLAGAPAKKAATEKKKVIGKGARPEVSSPCARC